MCAIEDRTGYVAARDSYLRAMMAEWNRLPGDPAAALLGRYIPPATTTPLAAGKLADGSTAPACLSALSAWANSRDRHLVLLGEPGAGKTSFARFLALSMAKIFPFGSAWPEEEVRLPLLPFILAPQAVVQALPPGARQGSAEMVEACLLESLKSREGARAFAAFALDALRENGGLVIFDGLDAVTGAARRRLAAQAAADFARQCQRQHPASHIMVTCRTRAFRRDEMGELGAWETHELKLFAR